MFSRSILTVTLLIFLGTSQLSLGQSRHYDFDSLLASNPQFKPLLNLVIDTFQIFGPEKPLEFTVSTDLKALQKNKFDDEYQTAKVIYRLRDTISISREIRIKPRGEFRLKNCSNPPLRVNVKKTEEVFQLLDDLGKLKMVVPCRGGSSYQSYIFTEYLAYRLYNIITDNSFQVRLIKLDYQDTAGKVKPGSAYTFIIENLKALAARRESIVIKNERVSARLLDPETAAILYLFQFMIGNTDWSVPGLHNMKLLKTEDVTRPNPVPVAYDFDYAGIVDAPYAIPGDHVDVESVTEREYMGYCMDENFINQAFDLFLEKESEIMQEIRDFDLMSNNSKKKTEAYIQKFYALIKDPKRRQNRITAKCKP